jgi:hypothetical protein
VVKRDLKIALNLNEVKTVLAILVAVFGAFFTLESRGQTNAATIVAPVAAQTAQNTADIRKLEGAVQSQAVEIGRQTVMLENLSKERGLPVPPRVALDGGQ